MTFSQVFIVENVMDRIRAITYVCELMHGIFHKDAKENVMHRFAKTTYVAVEKIALRKLWVN